MTILRRLVLFLAATLFALSLWVLAIDIGLVKTFGSSNNVKQIIADSGLYETIVPSALDQVNQEKKQVGESTDVPLTDAAIKEAAQRAITPAFLKQNVETVIDSLYKWLEGKTAQPDFVIDLAPIKANLADYVAETIQQRLIGLPVCPTNTSAQNFDYYNAGCLPKGVSAAAAAGQVKNEIANSQDFLGDTTYTAADIKSPDGNKPIFSGQLKDVPRAFQGFKASPLYLAILAVVAGLGVILLSTSRRRGIRRVGITLLTIGVLVLLFAWLLNYGSNRGLRDFDFENKVLQDNVSSLITDVSQAIGKSYWTIGGIYAGVGALAILGAVFIGRGKKKTEPVTAHEGKAAEPTDVKPDEFIETPAEPKPQPAARPVLEPKKPMAKPKPKAKPTVRKIKIS